MKFRTEFEPKRSSMTLKPDKPVVLAGSCFSQNMAAKMSSHGWEAVLPCGTLYNPFSICYALYILADKVNGLKKFEKSLFQYNGIWNSWWFDSSFSSLNKEDCLEEFIQRQKLMAEALEVGKTLIITFGSSICYLLKEGNPDWKENSGLIVGNCHKVPSDLFYTRRLTPSEILADWSVILEILQTDYPDLQTIFTVSPVRHLKNGFAGNAKSKAVLLLGVEEIVKYHEKCQYFPAFEIVNDDLRDYRFYASDMVHPSDEAIDYVWEKFTETFLDSEGKELLEKGGKEYRAARHRPKTGALGKPLV